MNAAVKLNSNELRESESVSGTSEQTKNLEGIKNLSKLLNILKQLNSELRECKYESEKLITEAFH